MKKAFLIFLCLLLTFGCAAKTTPQPPETTAPTAQESQAPAPVSEIVIATPAATPVPTPEPTLEPTPEPVGSHYTFNPKVASAFFGEVFGEQMVETWFNLVDAVMAGETTFACPDDHTYAWVTGQFPDKCLPPLYGQIVTDPTVDPDHPVQDGVAHIAYVTSPEELKARIDAFGTLVEDILNEALKDGDSDFEKAFALYSYFAGHYEYDYDTYYLMYDTYVDYLSTYRLLTTGKGICCEIGSAYAYLLMQAGVEAANMGGHDHDWAYVRINGKEYHIDPTWAVDTDGSLAYLMMDDAQREREGYPKDQHIILCNYAEDHPHPDYVADDDTFSALWVGFDAAMDRAAKTLHYRYYDENDDGALKEATFDYTGY